MIKIVQIFLGLFFFTSNFHAFEIAPDYLYSNSRDQRDLDNPALIDTEFEAASLSFTYSGYEEYAWLLSQNGFLGSSGSISSKEFHLKYHAKLSTQLSDNLNFQFQSLRDENFEYQSQANILEATYHIKNSNHSFSVYGDVFYDKRHNDVGFSYIYRFKSNNIRLYLTRPNFSYNDKNREDDFYDKQPKIYGYSITNIKDDGSFLVHNFRYQARNRLIFPSDGVSYNHESYYLGLNYRKSLKEDRFLRLKVEASKKDQDQKPYEGSSVDPIYLEARRYKIFSSLEKEKYELGGLISRREWYENDRNYSINMLHIFTKYTYLQSDVWTNSLKYIYSLSDGSKQGEIFRRASSRSDHRLDVHFSYRFDTSSHININLALDLDSLDSQPWEGGNVQFHFLF